MFDQRLFDYCNEYFRENITPENPMEFSGLGISVSEMEFQLVGDDPPQGVQLQGMSAVHQRCYSSFPYDDFNYLKLFESYCDIPHFPLGAFMSMCLGDYQAIHREQNLINLLDV